jgi:hypothetical protein
MSEVKISFGDLARSVSKAALESRSKLIPDPSMSLGEYQVLSPVQPESLDQFLSWLESKAEINITAANIFDLSLLSEEFGVLELSAKCEVFRCSTVSVSNFQNSSQQIEAIWNRLGRLEDSVSLLLREFSEKTTRETNLQPLKSSPRPSSPPSPSPIQPVRVSPSTPVPPVSPSKSLKATKFPLKEAESLEGIISYLTRKHGGNVDEKGIVTINSKSVDRDCPVRNVADLTSDSEFCSKNEPGQWIRWDFHEMRVRPTHYTIRTGLLKSWVVESSLDGEAWTEIDRKTDNWDFYWCWMAASFAVSKAECRFIRLTQTGKGHDGNDDLRIYAFEFFGTLLE